MSTNIKPPDAALLLLGLVFLPSALWAQVLQISGGLDGRYSHHEHPSGDDIRLEGAFLNLRKVWSDELGDRWIGVAQGDFDDNLQRVRPYQVYLQYKGPLGKWNVRAGHYLLPFGLLATHDTERLLLQGLEKIALGIRKDSGAEALGHLGPWDYAASLTDGLSDVAFADDRANPVTTARAAYVGDDWQLGASTLVGRVRLDPDFGIGRGVVSEQRFGLDATAFAGPLTMRAEGLGGTDEGRAAGGAIALVDYALTPSLEVNTRLATWHSSGGRYFAGLGLSYQFYPGLYLRAADEYELGERERNEITAQIYFEFAKQF